MVETNGASEEDHTLFSRVSVPGMDIHVIPFDFFKFQISAVGGRMMIIGREKLKCGRRRIEKSLESDSNKHFSTESFGGFLDPEP